MVGFPGETDQEHAESLAFIGEMAFAEQHIFRYSARPGTAAARLPDDVPPPVKKQRSEEAHQLDARLRQAYRSRFLGRTMDVLWEEQDTHRLPLSIAMGLPGWSGGGASPEPLGYWSGLTDNYLRVVAPGAVREGQITPVRLDRLAQDAIEGEITWTNASSAASSME